MEYQIDDLKFYSHYGWAPTNKNMFKAIWLGVQVIFAVQAISWAWHMKIECLVVAVVALWVAYQINKF